MKWDRNSAFSLLLLAVMFVLPHSTNAAQLSETQIREQLQLIKEQVLTLQERLLELVEARQAEFTIRPAVEEIESEPEATAVSGLDELVAVAVGNDIRMQVGEEEIEVPWQTASTTKEAQAAVSELDDRVSLLRIKLSQDSLPSELQSYRDFVGDGWDEVRPQMEAAIEAGDLQAFSRLWRDARAVDAAIEAGLDQTRALE